VWLDQFEPVRRWLAGPVQKLYFVAGAQAAVAAEQDDPPPRGGLFDEETVDAAARSGPSPAKPRRRYGGRIEDHRVARLEKTGKVAHVGVLDPVVGPAQDHHSGRVARLHGARRDQFRRQPVVKRVGPE